MDGGTQNMHCQNRLIGVRSFGEATEFQFLFKLPLSKLKTNPHFFFVKEN